MEQSSAVLCGSLTVRYIAALKLWHHLKAERGENVKGKTNFELNVQFGFNEVVVLKSDSIIWKIDKYNRYRMAEPTYIIQSSVLSSSVLQMCTVLPNTLSSLFTTFLKLN